MLARVCFIYDVKHSQRVRKTRAVCVEIRCEMKIKKNRGTGKEHKTIMYSVQCSHCDDIKICFRTIIIKIVVSLLKNRLLSKSFYQRFSPGLGIALKVEL